MDEAKAYRTLKLGGMEIEHLNSGDFSPESGIDIITAVARCDGVLRRSEGRQAGRQRLYTWDEMRDMRSLRLEGLHVIGACRFESYMCEVTEAVVVSKLRALALVDKILELGEGHVLVAGGAVVAASRFGPFFAMAHGPTGFKRRKTRHCPNDVDFFFWGLTPEDASVLLERILALFTNITRNNHAVSAQCAEEGLKYQFILRVYERPEHVLAGFDLQASSCLYDGNHVRFTLAGAFAVRYGLNYLDPSRRSPNYEQRLKKYAYQYEFGAVVPLARAPTAEELEAKGEPESDLQECISQKYVCALDAQGTEFRAPVEDFGDCCDGCDIRKEGCVYVMGFLCCADCTILPLRRFLAFGADTTLPHHRFLPSGARPREGRGLLPSVRPNTTIYYNWKGRGLGGTEDHDYDTPYKEGKSYKHRFSNMLSLLRGRPDLIVQRISGEIRAATNGWPSDAPGQLLPTPEEIRAMYEPTRMLRKYYNLKRWFPGEEQAVERLDRLSRAYIFSADLVADKFETPVARASVVESAKSQCRAAHPAFFAEFDALCHTFAERALAAAAAYTPGPLMWATVNPGGQGRLLTGSVEPGRQLLPLSDLYGELPGLDFSVRFDHTRRVVLARVAGGRIPAACVDLIENWLYHFSVAGTAQMLGLP